MTDYCIISSFKRYSYLKNNNRILKKSVIVTTDSDLLQYLDDNDQDNVDLWQYLKDYEVQENWEKTFNLSQSWWKFSSLDQFRYKNFNLCPAISFIMDFPFQAAFNTQTVVSKWLNILGKNDIVTFCNNHYQYYANLLYIETDILDSIVRWNAENKEIACRFYEVPKNLYNLAVTKSNKHIKKVKPKNGINDFYFNNIEKCKILFLVDYHPVEGEEKLLLKKIPSKLSQNILVTNYKIDGIKIPLEDQYRNVVDDFSLLSQEDFYYLHNCEYSIKKFQKEISMHKVYSFIFQNPYYKFELNNFSNKFRLCLENMIKFDKFISVAQPKIIIFGSSMSPEARVMMAYAKKCGILTMTFIHGGISNTAGYKHRILSTDNYFVSGVHVYEGLKKAGQEKTTIKLIGNPKLIGLEKYKKKMPDYRKSKKIITFITGRGGGMALAILNENKNRQSLNEIIELINRRQDYHFNIKIHPSIYDYDYIYRRLDSKTGLNLTVLDDYTIFDLLACSDIMVNFNYVSNATVEALILGKPALFYSLATNKIPANDTAFKNMSDWVVNSTEELEKKIDIILNMPKEQLDNVIQKRLNHFIIDNNTQWNERFWNVITTYLYDNNREVKFNNKFVKESKNILNTIEDITLVQKRV